MKVQTFKIEQRIHDMDVVIYPTLLTIKEKNYLIDSGYQETFSTFVAELRKLQVEITDLYAILVSHDDIDHIGALTLFKDVHPDLLIYCSEIEEPSISGKVKAERLVQAEQSLSMLPETSQAWALNFIDQLKSIRRTDVNVIFKNMDTIEEAVVVIFTPGHTKGHISFYIPGEKTLIANDALVLDGDQFDMANPMFTLDKKEAIKSVELIQSLAPEKIICYHGGIAEEKVSDKLADLVKRYEGWK